MKYLKIQNSGELDIRLLSLMGASTKKNDSTKIGQFGTGLKYAISFFIRNSIKFRLFIGKEEVKFSSVTTKIKDSEFEEIQINGSSMGVTTEYGYQWKGWEAIREIWCNAKDEADFSKSIGDFSKMVGKEGYTTFFIQLNEELQEVVDNWTDYFTNSKVIFENEKFKVYESSELTTGKIYKNGILVKDLEIKSIFNYDIKGAELNELRQYLNSPDYKIQDILLHSCPEVSAAFLKLIKSGSKDYYESRLDFRFLYLPFDYEKIRDNFKGFMFLHPDSSVENTERSIKVVKDLFEILQKSGLPCEKLTKRSASYYGGSSGGSDTAKDLVYREFKDPALMSRIKRILDKYDFGYIEYTTAIPFKDEFEIAMTTKGIVFSTDLVKLNDKDLECIVVIGIISHSGSGSNSIYTGFKKVLKMALNSRYLKKMLFN